MAGDEFGRTQKGNNNAYCQDDEISWVDWTLEEQHRKRVAFFRKLVELRNKYPILRRSRFFTGEANKEIEVKDVTWISADGSEMAPQVWDDGAMRCLGMLMDGRAQPTGIRKRGGDATLLMVLNAHHDLVKFKLPPCFDGGGWTRLLDTNDPDLPERKFRVGAVYSVTSRSLLLFERAPNAKA